MRGATVPTQPTAEVNTISIHAPLAGRDTGLVSSLIPLSISIHAPLAGRDSPPPRHADRSAYFNPRAPCGARQEILRNPSPRSSISIHAPLAGRDIEDSINHRFRLVFQSTRPLRGATEDILAHATHLPEFQSTRPLRGATFAPNASPTAARFQSTRPLRGATWPSRTRWEPA